MTHSDLQNSHSANSQPDSISHTLRKLFGLDLRSLALFRIALGFYIICDLLIYSQDIGAFFTDEGILPRSIYTYYFQFPWIFSLHLISGKFEIQLFLFLINFLAAFCFMLGYRTRLANFITWLLFFSLHNRNMLIIQGGDDLARMMLFWSLFLPMGAVYSLDRLLNSGARKPDNHFFSIGSVALLGQVVIMYLFTAIHKSGPEWFEQASAVYYALHIDQHATAIGLYLRELPLEVLAFLTHATMIFEFMGPLLLFSPIFFVPIRMLAILGFLLMHIGFQASLAVGVFSYISVVAMIPFLPAWFWDSMLARLSRFKLIASAGLGIKKRLSALMQTVIKLIRAFPNPSYAIKVSRFTNYLAAFFLGFVLLYNVESVINYRLIPQSLRWMAYTFQIGQYWVMFSPFPLKHDGWDVMVGKLESGKEIDIFKDFDRLEKQHEVSWDKPKYVYATFKRQRWRHAIMGSRLEGPTPLRLAMLDYFCRGWNKKHEGGERLVDINWYHMLEITQPNNQAALMDKVLLAYRKCGEDKPAPTISFDHLDHRPPDFDKEKYCQWPGCVFRVP